jgi:hypothetical protein
MVYLAAQNQGFPLQIFRISENFREKNTTILLLSLNYHGLWWVGCQKIAKHCYVCDTYGCLGSTALPEQELSDFFTNTIRTFLTYILPDFFHTISSILPGEKE